MIRREGEAPEAEGDVDWPVVVVWWSIYAIVVSALVIHMAAG
jgi:hypothetical protein